MQLLPQYLRRNITLNDGFKVLTYSRDYYLNKVPKIQIFKKLFANEPKLYENLIVKFSKSWTTSLLNSVVTEACRVCFAFISQEYF